MMIVTIENINPNKLHDELINAGLTPVLVENDRPENSHIASHTWITFVEGTDMTAVQAVIDTHDPTPLPPQPTKEELLQQEIDELKAVVDAMLNGGDA